MLIRDATTADWPVIWPFLHQIVAAGDTFTYDPELGKAEAMWMVGAPGRVVVAAADGADVVGTANMYANRSGPGAHIASASYALMPLRASAVHQVAAPGGHRCQSREGGRASMTCSSRPGATVT